MFETVDIDTLSACRSYAYSKGEEVANLHQLMVFDRMADIKLASNDFRLLSSLASGIKFGTHRVIVAETDLSFGLSRMFQTLRDEIGDAIEVTNQLAKAAQVLEIPLSTLNSALKLEVGTLVDGAGLPDQDPSGANDL